MKRLLLSILAVGITFSIAAQDRDLIKNQAIAIDPVHFSQKEPLKSFINSVPLKGETSILEEDYIDESVSIKSNAFVNMTKDAGIKNNFDQHSQGSLYQMMHLYDDGFVGAAWTASENGWAIANRDIMYASSEDYGKSWRVEYPVAGKHGYWPAYLPWGDNGEMIMVRLGSDEYSGYDGLAIYRRESKGEGEWEVILVDNPEEKTLVWHRCCVTGEHNEYLHVVVSCTDDYQGYTANPIVYNRSSDGGNTWDFEWTLVPDLIGETWPEGFNFVESVSWAEPQGSNIAFLCASVFSYCPPTILKSTDNGDTWSKIVVWDCALDISGPDAVQDTGFRALHGGSIAFDRNGKLHALMNSILAVPDAATVASIGWYPSRPYYNALVYWNESRGTYNMAEMDERIENWRNNFYEYWVDDTGAVMIDYARVTRKFDEYVVGGPVPIDDQTGTIGDDDKRYYDFNWIQPTEMSWNIMDSYRQTGAWPWPQMIFDNSNRLHMIYAGLLDNAKDANDHQRRHIFYTSTQDEFKTHVKHADMNNVLAVKNNEFAYSYLAGWLPGNKFLYMVQVDPLSGLYSYDGPCDPTENNMYAFTVELNGINGITGPQSAAIPMNVYPNPATSSVTVDFSGTCSIELYNMVGQRVYSVENVRDSHQISTQNLTGGVYFVTVRDGKKMSTQKLIVQ